MAAIVDNSTLHNHDYVPYMHAWNLHLQGIIHAFYNIIHSKYFKVKYYTEVFSLSDGEKIALLWVDEPQPKKYELGKNKGPLLVMTGGLGGGQSAVYLKNVMSKARGMGY